jgi:predicted PurR-regulated permease PerM
MGAPAPELRPELADRVFVRRAFLTLGMAVLAFAVWRLSNVLLLVFASVLTAVILRSIASLLARYTFLSERAGFALSCLTVFGGLIAFAALFGAQLGAQLSEIAARLPEAANSLGQRFQVKALSGNMLEQAKANPGTVLSALTSVTLGLFGVLADAVVVMIAGLYLASAPANYRRGVVRLFAREQQARIEDTLDFVGAALTMWLGGRLVAMATVGVLAGAGLACLGVPSSLALGVIAGAAEFIPVLGPFFGGVPAVLVAFSEGASLGLWALLLLVVIQILESNLISPIVDQYTVAMPPALTLFSVMAFGVIFGLLGLLLAAPLTLACLVAVKKLYVRDTLGQKTEIPGEPGG